MGQTAHNSVTESSVANRSEPVGVVLGRWVAGLRIGDLPADVQVRAKLLLLDTAGAILRAALMPEARPLLEHVEETGGRGEAVAVGLESPVPARQAAFCNGWLADLLDLEDIQKVGGNHPSATIMPAALAMGQRQGNTGAEILTAIVAGYEVANRLSRSVFPQHNRHGHLATGTSGAVGAAAAAASLLELNAEQATQALHIAGYLLPFSAADTVWDGLSAKPSHAGQAAAVGVEAAMLAARGFQAAPLEGGTTGHGFLSMVADAPNYDEITQNLGAAFSLADCAMKAYPTCGLTHGPIDAALAVRAQLGETDPDQIQRVTVRAHDVVAKYVGQRYTDTASTLTVCQFSAPYLVAAALIDGEVGLEQIGDGRRADLAIHELGRRVIVLDDPSMTARVPAELPCEIEVEVGGRTLTADISAPLGTPQRPLTLDAIRRKYEGLVAPVLGLEGGRVLAEMIERLEEQPAFAWPAVTALAASI